MEIVSLLAFAALSTRQQVPDPALWLKPDGQVTIEGKRYTPAISDGTHLYRTARGMAWDFDGKRSGLLFPDLNTFKMSGSMTVAAWVNPRSYVNDGPGAQLLFRGDDRNGHDPYGLTVMSDGSVRFGIQDEQDRGRLVMGDIPLHQWTHVQGCWNAETGELRLWIDGELTAYARTIIRPFVELDRGQAPGLGIGNVQNNRGPHNQPFNGQILDLRMYRGAFSPEEIGIWTGPQTAPPPVRSQNRN